MDQVANILHHVVRHHDAMDHTDHMATTTAATAAAAMETGSHDDMDMGGGDGTPCKISMLLNYNTVDSCFISSDWQVKSIGMFAGSCIGIALLAIFLELLRRSVKEFDKYLARQHMARHAGVAEAAARSSDEGVKGGAVAGVTGAAGPIPPFRPTFWQQGIRAILHTAQFTVAYFIMLLAMYYNVYILVSIFLGILVGSYIFQYETIDFSEPTVCCG
ncbi:solute carrier family 31 (copper transporter) [Emericellopsis cladophorae]|uniref:Copper transport protein n=1 Tax=Emericellopsis cladophorae TaxID=2686198 RepID=A0A9Q0BEW8_9HYPO|nr:solute carrier family 31 (copper transporter) [Emericellopsis cladophorae]KAI6782316.1 solute carrier family 31 (copper transporter) [Emericellopsis cladophorae]